MRARKLTLCVIVTVILALIFSLGGTVAAAPGNIQEQDAPKIRQSVIVHYLQGLEQGQVYQSMPNEIHWENPSVDYFVNLGRLDQTFLTGITNAFDSWDDASLNYAPVYNDTTKSSPGSLQARWNRKLQQFVRAKNVVGWKKLGRRYPGAIAVTYLWWVEIEPGHGHLIEVDTVLNSDRTFHWWQIPTTGETWPTQGYTSDAYDVDVQNIMIHEAGHWLFLEDLYDDPSSEQTMYGYSYEYELKKRSIENGDIAGIQGIYGP